MMLREWTSLPFPLLWEQQGSAAHATSVTPKPTLCMCFPAFSGYKSNMKLRNPKAYVRLPAIQVGDKSLFKLLGSPAPNFMVESHPSVPAFPGTPLCSSSPARAPTLNRISMNTSFPWHWNTPWEIYFAGSFLTSCKEPTLCPCLRHLIRLMLTLQHQHLSPRIKILYKILHYFWVLYELEILDISLVFL